MDRGAAWRREASAGLRVGVLLPAIVEKGTVGKLRNSAMDESAGEPLILDESILVDLEQRLGRDRVASFTHMLRAELDEVLDILSSPATSWETIASQAHSMVSLAGNLGCMELMTRSRELMNALRGGAKEAADLVTAMSSALGRADAALAERYPEGVAADA